MATVSAGLGHSPLSLVASAGAGVPTEAAAGSGRRSEENHPAAQTGNRHHRERLSQPQAAAAERCQSFPFPPGSDALIHFLKIHVARGIRFKSGPGLVKPVSLFFSFQQVWTRPLPLSPLLSYVSSCSSGGGHVGVGGAPPPREAPAAEATAERPVLPAEAPAAEEAREGRAKETFAAAP